MRCERKGGFGGAWGAVAIALCAGAAWQFAGSVVPTAPHGAAAAAASAPHWRPAFESNAGQFDPQVRYLLRGPGYRVHLLGDGALLQGRDGAPVHLRIVGADGQAGTRGEQRLPGARNYLLGSDPSAWRHGVPAYEAVRYSGVYPGIDLVYHGRNGALEYDFVLAPGADPTDIRLRYDGARPARRADGALLIGGVVQLPPVAYQEVEGKRRHVEVDYALLASNEVAFRVGAYDASRTLVIDPVLTFSTPLGGAGADRANAVAADGDGATYVAGQTASADFPATGSSFLTSVSGGTDAFVAKFDASGELVYATYLGGSGNDIAYALAVDDLGNAYVAGETASSDDFPRQEAIQPNYGGGDTDAFAAKLSFTGASLVYATYLGGGASDSARAIAVDIDGATYVGGATASEDYPTNDAFQSQLRGDVDAFLTKILPEGVGLTYSTYLGGDGNSFSQAEHIAAIALNAAGEAHVAGLIASDNMPWVNPTQSALHGPGDAFIARFSATGSELTFGTYFGGTLFERATGLALDSDGNMYLTGITGSGTDFPASVGAFQTVYGGGSFDGFVAKFTATSFLEYSTYLGGGGSDQPAAIALVDGQAYIVGETSSTNFPRTGALQVALNGVSDAFVTRLNAQGSAVDQSTFLGGSGEDGATAAVWAGDVLHVAGRSASSDFPTRGVAQSLGGAGEDAWLARLTASDVSADVSATLAIVETGDFLTLGVPFTYRSTVSNQGPDDATGIEWRADLPAGLNAQSASSTQGTCSATSGSAVCAIDSLAAGASATVDVVVVATAAGNHTNVARILRADQPDPVPTNNSASADGVVTGDASGGGAWGPWPFLLLLLFGALRRR